MTTQSKTKHTMKQKKSTTVSHFRGVKQESEEEEDLRNVRGIR
jgi:hypothetical protein